MTLSTFIIGGQLRVNRLGFGAMRLCGQPGNFGRYPRWEEGIALLRRSRNLGVNLFDTAEAYGPGCNEELIAEALHPYVDSDGNNIVIATKGGVLKTSPTEIRANGHPDALRQSCEASLRRLRIDCIDLYQLHRPDPQVPWEDSVGAMVELQAAGKIRLVGVSNVSLEQLEAAGCSGTKPLQRDRAEQQNRARLLQATRNRFPTLGTTRRSSLFSGSTARHGFTND